TKDIMRKILLTIGLSALTSALWGQTDSLSRDTISYDTTLGNVTVKARQGGKSRSRVTNTDIIGQGELIRAACCNLGESFTTNPSVDVSYSDAATGARQIKLLGLSGTYVQMLTENMPNLRGASIPYSLGYIPGPWMQSIQVSKGASSVKHGYESITGQINVEYIKPQGTDGVRANAYLDTDLKQEVNVDGSLHLRDRLSMSGLLHFENRQTDHDKDGDGFMDMPKLRQYNGMWRMAYVSPLWISQMSLKGLHDERASGMSHHGTLHEGMPRYGIEQTANRYELQWKNGFTLDSEHSTSVALMLNGSIHDASNRIGNSQYEVNQKNGYAQLMFETDFTPEHNLSVGTSLNHDFYSQALRLDNPLQGEVDNLYGVPHETTVGVYAQYTYKLGERLTVMPGFRWDYSTEHGSFCTPRLHIKYTPWESLTLRASAGKGYRSAHAIAENVSLLASGKIFLANDRIRQEEAWNTGISASLHIPLADKDLEVNMDYYYTDFNHQLIINPDGAKGENSFSFENLSGKSYTHAAQVDVTYPFFEGFTAMGAFRYVDSRTTYDGLLRRRPLTSRYKGLLTMGYKTPLELWHFDVTSSVNGGGVLYDGAHYPAYFQLQAQITREFHRFSVYVGGENLTNYTIPEPIRGANHPWTSAFDATQVWGPLNGAMGYIGVRFKMEKL
ncbi:MAG: TonB-dependent receptor plug domain-containing protein, partial [Bacteroidaceae bacterium]